MCGFVQAVCKVGLVVQVNVIAPYVVYLLLDRRAMFALEYETIAIYRRFGAQLLNMTNQDQKGVLQVVV